jgi:hypothetical protein
VVIVRVLRFLCSSINMSKSAYAAELLARADNVVEQALRRPGADVTGAQRAQRRRAGNNERADAFQALQTELNAQQEKRQTATSLGETIVQLRGKAEGLEDAIADIDDDVELLDKELSELNSRMAAAREELAHCNAQLPAAVRRREELVEKRRQTVGELGVAEKEIDHKQSVLNELEANMRAIMDNISQHSNLLTASPSTKWSYEGSIVEDSEEPELSEGTKKLRRFVKTSGKLLRLHADLTAEERSEEAQQRWTEVCRAIRRGYFTAASLNGDGSMSPKKSFRRSQMPSSPSFQRTATSPTRTVDGAVVRSLQAEIALNKRRYENSECMFVAMRDRYDHLREELVALRSVVAEYDGNTVNDLVAEIRFYKKERRQLYDKLYNNKPYAMPLVRRIYGDADDEDDDPLLSKVARVRAQVSKMMKDNLANPESYASQAKIVDGLRMDKVKLGRRLAAAARRFEEYRIKLQCLEQMALFSNDDLMSGTYDHVREVNAVREQSYAMQERMVLAHDDEKKAWNAQTVKFKDEITNLRESVRSLEGELADSRLAIAGLNSEAKQIIEMNALLEQQVKQLSVVYTVTDLSAFDNAVHLIEIAKPEFATDPSATGIDALDDPARSEAQAFIDAMYTSQYRSVLQVAEVFKNLAKGNLRKNQGTEQAIPELVGHLREIQLCAKKACLDSAKLLQAGIAHVTHLFKSGRSFVGNEVGVQTVPEKSEVIRVGKTTQSVASFTQYPPKDAGIVVRPLVFSVATEIESRFLGTGDTTAVSSDHARKLEEHFRLKLQSAKQQETAAERLRLAAREELCNQLDQRADHEKVLMHAHDVLATSWTMVAQMRRELGDARSTQEVKIFVDESPVNLALDEVESGPKRRYFRPNKTQTDGRWVRVESPLTSGADEEYNSEDEEEEEDEGDVESAEDDLHTTTDSMDVSTRSGVLHRRRRKTPDSLQSSTTLKRPVSREKQQQHDVSGTTSTASKKTTRRRAGSETADGHTPSASSVDRPPLSRDSLGSTRRSQRQGHDTPHSSEPRPHISTKPERAESSSSRTVTDARDKSIVGGASREREKAQHADHLQQSESKPPHQQAHQQVHQQAAQRTTRPPPLSDPTGGPVISAAHPHRDSALHTPAAAAAASTLATLRTSTHDSPIPADCTDVALNQPPLKMTVAVGNTPTSSSVTPKPIARSAESQTATTQHCDVEVTAHVNVHHQAAQTDVDVVAQVDIVSRRTSVTSISDVAKDLSLAQQIAVAPSLPPQAETMDQSSQTEEIACEKSLESIAMRMDLEPTVTADACTTYTPVNNEPDIFADDPAVLDGTVRSMRSSMLPSRGGSALPRAGSAKVKKPSSASSCRRRSSTPTSPTRPNDNAPADDFVTSAANTVRAQSPLLIAPPVEAAADRDGMLRGFASQTARFEEEIADLHAQLAAVSAAVEVTAELEATVERLREERDYWRHQHEKLENEIAGFALGNDDGAATAFDALDSRANATVANLESQGAPGSRTIPPRPVERRVGLQRKHFTLSEVFEQIRTAQRDNENLRVKLTEGKSTTSELQVKLDDALLAETAAKKQRDTEAAANRRNQALLAGEVRALKEQARSLRNELLQAHEDVAAHKKAVELSKNAAERRVAGLQAALAIAEKDRDAAKAESHATKIQEAHDGRMASADRAVRRDRIRADAVQNAKDLATQRALNVDLNSRLQALQRQHDRAIIAARQQPDAEEVERAAKELNEAFEETAWQVHVRAFSLHKALIRLMLHCKNDLHLPVVIDDPAAGMTSAKMFLDSVQRGDRQASLQGASAVADATKAVVSVQVADVAMIQALLTTIGKDARARKKFIGLPLASAKRRGDDLPDEPIAAFDDAPATFGVANTLPPMSLAVPLVPAQLSGRAHEYASKKQLFIPQMVDANPLAVIAHDDRRPATHGGNRGSPVRIPQLAAQALQGAHGSLTVTGGRAARGPLPLTALRSSALEFPVLAEADDMLAAVFSKSPSRDRPPAPVRSATPTAHAGQPSVFAAFVAGMQARRASASAQPLEELEGWNRGRHTVEIAQALESLPPRPATTIPSSTHPVSDITVGISPTAVCIPSEGLPRRVGTPVGPLAGRHRRYLWERAMRTASAPKH